MSIWVVLVGMIAHGHGDAKLAHYAIDLYLENLRHTIGLFAKLLHDLQKPLAYSSRLFFENAGLTPSFEAVLIGKKMHAWIHCHNPLMSL